MASFEKIASAIFNDVYGGLRGMHSNIGMSVEQLEDDVMDERLQIIKEYSLKGILPKKDLLMSINCIPIDCKDIERCRCNDATICGTPTAHFEIPQILTEYGGGIEYIGSTDRELPFKWYTSPRAMRYHKYRRRSKHRPYVYIDITPNENNMYDCFVYNAPLLKEVSVVGIFKDLRQLDNYGCCDHKGRDIDIDNFTFIDTEIKKRLTEKKLRYYRMMKPPILPNDQTYQ